MMAVVIQIQLWNYYCRQRAGNNLRNNLKANAPIQ